VRVALVHPHISRSSSLERDTVLLATGLVSHGLDVHCYCNPATRTVDIPGVTFHDVPAVRIGRVSPRSRLSHPLERATFAVMATRALRRDRHRYDIVDVRQTAALTGDVLQVDGVIAALQRRWPVEAGRMFRGSRLRAVAAPVVRPQIGVDRVIQRRQLRPGRFVRVIAVTPQVRDDLVEMHDVPFDLIDVVPYAVDLDRIGRAEPTGVRAMLGIPPGQPLVLFVGHSFQRKGLDVLITALTGLPEGHLIVVGDDDPRSVAEGIRRGGLEARVHFVGGVDDPERYYAEADLFAFPTRTEPWGIPLIEAMAAGIPVVSTSIAGASEVVADAHAGIILDDHSPDAFREALRALIDDPDLRRQMGSRGRIAAGRFDVESHAAAVIETYHRTLRDADSRRN
jgi:UDP-glucose:(heptosyl)LPS alpha-1,3-glucosyltransferase